MQKTFLFHPVSHKKKEGGANSSLMVTYWFPLELQILEKQEENRHLNTRGGLREALKKYNSHNSTMY